MWLCEREGGIKAVISASGVETKVATGQPNLV